MIILNPGEYPFVNHAEDILRTVSVLDENLKKFKMRPSAGTQAFVDVHLAQASVMLLAYQYLDRMKSDPEFALDPEEGLRELKTLGFKPTSQSIFKDIWRYLEKDVRGMLENGIL